MAICLLPQESVRVPGSNLLLLVGNGFVRQRQEQQLRFTGFNVITSICVNTTLSISGHWTSVQTLMLSVRCADGDGAFYPYSLFFSSISWSNEAVPQDTIGAVTSGIIQGSREASKSQQRSKCWKINSF